MKEQRFIGSVQKHTGIPKHYEINCSADSVLKTLASLNIKQVVEQSHIIIGENRKLNS